MNSEYMIFIVKVNIIKKCIMELQSGLKIPKEVKSMKTV